MDRNLYFREFAKGLILKGKSKECAFIATVCKFIRCGYWMLKEESLFSFPKGRNTDPLEKIREFLRERDVTGEYKISIINRAKRYLERS